MAREVDFSIHHPTFESVPNWWNDAINLVLKDLGDSFPSGDLSISVHTNSGLAKIHEDFLSDPTETDVITFPGDPDMDFAGEICISVDRAAECHNEHGTQFIEELTLYLIHGLLHLAGFGDKTQEESVMMRTKEQKMLDLIKHHGLLS